MTDDPRSPKQEWPSEAPPELEADFPRSPRTEADLELRARFLADLAARAVTEPRRFHEDADQQHDLSVAIADVRRALAEAAAPRSGGGLREAADAVVQWANYSEKLGTATVPAGFMRTLAAALAAAPREASEPPE